MERLDLLVCGHLWRDLGYQQAGRELLHGLMSADPELSALAQDYLLQAGAISISLIQSAIEAGDLQADGLALTTLNTLKRQSDLAFSTARTAPDAA